jgi:glycosyltransferase involved in cell wall biosynthesis
MPESNKLVSVVITCYNYGKYLANCIDSVFAQTYKNIEVIVVNDGSTDNSDEVIQKYLSDSRIRYINQKNAGQANAKNTGIRNSRGSFIAFLDADDLWAANKLEKQIPLFSGPSEGVVYCPAKYVDEAGHELNFVATDEYLNPRSGNVTEWLFTDNFVPFSSAVVRKECLEQYGVFDEALKMGIDWDLWLRISAGYKFAFVDERLFYYRIGHPGQMSKNLEVRQGCSDRIMETFIKEHPGVLSAQSIRRAYIHTYCNRGEYFRMTDLKKSCRYFVSAIKANPFESRAYKGMLKNLFFTCGILKS